VRCVVHDCLGPIAQAIPATISPDTRSTPTLDAPTSSAPTPRLTDAKCTLVIGSAGNGCIALHGDHGVEGVGGGEAGGFRLRPHVDAALGT